MIMVLELRALDVVNSSGLSMKEGTLSHELKAIDDISSSKPYAQGFRCYERLWVMVDMNDSWL